MSRRAWSMLVGGGVAVIAIVSLAVVAGHGGASSVDDVPTTSGVRVTLPQPVPPAGTESAGTSAAEPAGTTSTGDEDVVPAGAMPAWSPGPVTAPVFVAPPPPPPARPAAAPPVTSTPPISTPAPAPAASPGG
jgi:hypothetical protein